MAIKQNLRVLSLLMIAILATVCALVILPRQSVAQENPEVEFLGNPFAERYADENQFYKRNIWTMFVFDGRIYFGGGDSASNSGPVDVWSYDPETGEFNREYAVDEEQIDRYMVYDGMLHIPGHDARDGWNLGNFYRLEPEGWKKYRTVPNATHVYDLYEYEGRLFAAIGNNREVNYVALVSDDGGMTWTPVPAPQDIESAVMFFRGWELFEINGDLYLNVFSFPNPDQPPPGGGRYPAVFRYDGEQLIPAETDFFPSSSSPSTYARIIHVTEIGDHTVYIGAQTVNDHHWQSFGLYAIDSRLQVQPLLSDRGLQFWDIFFDGEALYVLASQDVEDSQQVIVLSSHDLVTWDRLVTFTAETYARSFTLLYGDFYFGLGCDTEDSSETCGNALRISGLVG